MTDTRPVPYAADHARSIGRSMRRGRPPRGLEARIRWYSAGWEAETPARAHVRGVWHDGEASSALGAPQDASQWRRYFYGQQWDTDPDGFYVRPMHAALASMSGDDVNGGVYPFMARYLLQLALGGWDWKGLGARWGMCDELAYVYTETALDHLWKRYYVMPPVIPSGRASID